MRKCAEEARFDWGTGTGRKGEEVGDERGVDSGRLGGDELGDRRGEESFVKSAKLSLRKDEVLGAIDKLQHQDK